MVLLGNADEPIDQGMVLERMIFHCKGNNIRRGRMIWMMKLVHGSLRVGLLTGSSVASAHHATLFSPPPRRNPNRSNDGSHPPLPNAPIHHPALPPSHHRTIPSSPIPQLQSRCPLLPHFNPSNIPSTSPHPNLPTWPNPDTENNQSSPPATVDLHGLYVKEAIERTESAIASGQASGQEELRVIVGKGIHSQGGVAKIRPAVEGLMQK